MEHLRTKSARADYGLDAPLVIRNLLVAAFALLVAGIATFLATRRLLPRMVAITAVCTAIPFFTTAGLMYWSSRVGKLRLRDRLLDGLSLQGNETVLDVGTGHGLLLIGAARRLPGGRAVGIDLWSQEDQHENSRNAALANAAAEGVENIEIHDGDMRSMPFPDASFDAVVASLSIHNIYAREGRRQAIAEIVRVLKPGGQVALMDFRHVRQYADDLQAAGLIELSVSRPSFRIFPAVRTVTARKA